MRTPTVLAAALLAALPLRAQDKPDRREQFLLENPVEPRIKLVLEDAYRPGTMVDVAQYKGKVVVLRAVACE